MIDTTTLVDMAIYAATAGDYVGFCVSCGCEHYNVEPDARRYECEDCGKYKVYGAEEILMMFGA